ncbi:hypothetical protein VIGAN_09174800 [Vigna angularis var. angularis]|uniref:Uncharacterized protein n=1 Tax=Vigna angularis var. angularis TaxID=157739 RepID=A0A0S3SYM4_PHAAN|nr:hypothetical protein VIGAN_09174800 [Vigna angularis var. angularis]
MLSLFLTVGSVHVTSVLFNCWASAVLVLFLGFFIHLSFSFLHPCNSELFPCPIFFFHPIPISPPKKKVSCIKSLDLPTPKKQNQTTNTGKEE